MIERSSPLFAIGDLIADAVNPILALCLIGYLFVQTRRRQISLNFWVAAFLGVALVYVLRTVDRRADLWEQIGGDYSTHSAVAMAMIIPLIFLQRRLWPILVGVLVCYAALMIVLGFHTLLDIATTLLVVAPLVALIHLALLRGGTREPAEVNPLQDR